VIGITDKVELIAASMANDPSPAEVRAFEVALAGLIWKANAELARADIALKKAIQEAPEKSAAAKKQFAEAGPAYERWKEAEAIQVSCQQMLITCRSNVRSLSEEMRLTRG
jgi:hypothetical protein